MIMIGIQVNFNYILKGHFIKKFEDRFKEYLGVREVIAVSSGRFALLLILKKLGLGQNDKIMLSAYNFAGVPKALLQEGYFPVFVDADQKTYQIDPQQIEGKIDKETKAIIITHIFGQPCELDKILDIAKRHNLFVIEDAAHSLGSYYCGKLTGAIGDAGFFSFTGTKTINTSFGGMIVTNNTDLARQIREELQKFDFPKAKDLIKQRLITRIYSWLNHRLFYSLVGYPIALLMSVFDLDPLEIFKSIRRSDIAEQKLRFTNLQALLGLKQLDCLNDLICKRKRVAAQLINHLDSAISIPRVPRDSESNYFMFPIKTKDKKKAFKKLLKKGIDSNLNYCCDCSYMVGNSYNPVAQSLCRSILALNLPFDLQEQEVVYLAEALNGMKAWLN